MRLAEALYVRGTQNTNFTPPEFFARIHVSNMPSPLSAKVRRRVCFLLRGPLGTQRHRWTASLGYDALALANEIHQRGNGKCCMLQMSNIRHIVRDSSIQAGPDRYTDNARAWLRPRIVPTETTL